MSDNASTVKTATTDHPVHEFVARRWSPCAFAERPVELEDLRSLFEAARWAPSSFNEQPWRYIVARKQDEEAFAKLLSCLVEGNQTWARTAPVLALGCVALDFARNGKPNKAALHDLGLAAGNLLLEASARDLYLHQMIGILPDRARELYAIPERCEAVTGIAIGYPGDPASLPDSYRARDLAPRSRKPLAEFVFGARWGRASELL